MFRTHRSHCRYIIEAAIQSDRTAAVDGHSRRGLIALGISPTTRLTGNRRVGSGDKTADIRARVYGWRGFAIMAAVGASSTMWPRYMTATRWLRRSTAMISCEMNRYATDMLL